jgi:hypothetical protein
MAEEAEESEVAKKIRAVIDRIEDGGMAVIQVGDDKKALIDFPASLLPKGASDGDHLQISITLDKSARDSAEEGVRSMQDRLSKQSGTEGKKDFKL